MRADGLKPTGDDLETVDEVIAEAEQEIERLNAALAAHRAKTGRDVWAENLRRLEEQATSRDREIAKRKKDAEALAGVIGLRGVADHPVLLTLGAYYKAVSGTPGSAQLRESEHALHALLPEAVAWISERQREISAVLHKQSADLSALREKLNQNADSRGQAYLEDGTRRLMRRLESAGMDARPLCDLVEITDPDWVPAAEALLGRDREAIFVRRDEIHAATRLFKESRREFQRASLVSLNKLEPSHDAPRPGAFPSIFRSADRDAMAFSPAPIRQCATCQYAGRVQPTGSGTHEGRPL